MISLFLSDKTKMFQGKKRIKTALKFALVFTICGFLKLSCLAGDSNEPARVFKPALDQIRGKTQIPILLPWKLPWLKDPGDIKLALGEIQDDGYSISLYYDSSTSNASYAAGFEASTKIFKDLGTHVRLADGRIAQFSPVSCGGSCAPANLWWEQNHVMYNIQIKFSSSTPVAEQKKILIETANCSVKVR
jgi:hypothetical protein